MILQQKSSCVLFTHKGMKTQKDDHIIIMC